MKKIVLLSGLILSQWCYANDNETIYAHSTPLANKSSSPEEHILELNNKLLKATRDCDITNTLKALTQGAKSNNGKGLLEYLTVLSAAQCFDDRILDTLMQHNFSPSARGILPYEEPVIITMADQGNIQAVKRLLNAGADIDQEGWHGDTALLNAVKECNTHMVKALLVWGADPSKANFFGETPETVIPDCTGASAQKDLKQIEFLLTRAKARKEIK